MPFLVSDQYGEIRVLDRGTKTVTSLDLKEVFLALAELPSKDSELSLRTPHPKIIEGEFSVHGTPYDLASVGAIQVQMWIGSKNGTWKELTR